MVSRVMARRAFRMRWQLFYTTGHAQTFQPHTVRQLDLRPFERLVTAGGVKRNAGKGRHELAGAKARLPRLLFGAVDDHPADAAAGMGWIDEHRPDARRLGSRIEPAIDGGLPCRSGEELLPLAPSAAGHDLAGFFNDKVRPVLDDLRIGDCDEVKRARHLIRVIELRPEG